MNNVKISIITVCYNASSVIEDTILSVINQTYCNKEYIIIDGDSNDGTVDIIKKYEDHIDNWISEPDNGIFDAMNKGIRMASGEWINMMNAGDRFFSEFVLEDIFSKAYPQTIQFLYSDCEMRFPNGINYIRNASEEEGNIFHQASIYKKKLHEVYGYYCVKNHLVMSDALFFNLIPSNLYYRVPVIIASYDMGGTSVQNISCRIQIACIKYIFHKISLTDFVKRIIRGYFLSLIPEQFTNKARKIKNKWKLFIYKKK